MVIIKILGFGLLILVVLVLIGLLELYTQVSRYQNYWQRQNATIDVQNIAYVALGDSTAQGLGATHPSKGYVGLIGEELGAQPFNLSKSGAKVEDVLYGQLPQLEKLPITDKTIVTIEIGANDVAGDFDAAKFEAEMTELLDRLPEQTVISDIPYFGASRYRSKEINVKVANDIMYRIAGERGFKLAALHEQMRRNGGLTMFAVDWFHPSDISYRENWAAAFLERIREAQ